MRTSSKILILVAAIALGLLLYLALRPTPLSAQAQIEQQTANAVNAANAHNAGGVMAILSSHYIDDNGYNRDAVHALLLRALQGTPSLHVLLSPSVITVQGNQAISKGYLVAEDRQSGRTLYSHEVMLVWHRESARSFFLFPIENWRVVSASYGSAQADLESGL